MASVSGCAPAPVGGSWPGDGARVAQSCRPDAGRPRTATDVTPQEAVVVSPSFEMLRRSPDIKQVLADGRRTTGTRVVLYVVPEGSSIRAGFACPRSIGGAVVRNRARRLMKEAWRGSVSRVREGCEVMIVARPEIRSAKVSEVSADLEQLLAAAGVLR